MIKIKNFSDTQLARFRELQRLSFEILEETAASLKLGDTEKTVTRGLVKKYRKAGANGFFHLPVALFGERTALPGDWKTGHFFPRDREIKENDSVVLDSAPLFDGYMVDTSYSFCFGENPEHAAMMAKLEQFRAQVCDAVNAGHSFKTIADQVATDITGMGYEPVHTKHPGEVLGHRAIKTAKLPFTWRIKGFDGLSLGWFILKGKAVQSGLSKGPPTWNYHDTSDHPPLDGLWLVEPHAGDGPVGAKWEEILVIENGKAHWLDDDTPHMRQWRQIRAGKSYRPQSKAPVLA